MSRKEMGGVDDVDDGCWLSLLFFFFPYFNLRHASASPDGFPPSSYARWVVPSPSVLDALDCEDGVTKFGFTGVSYHPTSSCNQRYHQHLLPVDLHSLPPGRWDSLAMGLLLTLSHWPSSPLSVTLAPLVIHRHVGFTIFPVLHLAPSHLSRFRIFSRP